MEVNIIELASQCPDITISVKASDLIAAGKTIKDELLEAIQTNQAEIPAKEAEQLLSQEETMAKFHISSATIWRWKKCGYLVPVKVGSLDRYRLAAEMYIREPDDNPYRPKTANKTNTPNPEPTPLPSAPRMSFYRKPIKNTRPSREASPEDIFKYLISDYAKRHTETIRTIADNKARSNYKARHLDYITPGGIFRSRKESDLVKASGYMVIDFDHIPDPQGLVKKLANDEHFETVLAFRSPSGDGVKWIVALPTLSKADGTPLTYGEYFTILSNYSHKYYGVQADPSGKDICRACFLPYDPDAFLNPLYIENNFNYDIDKFLS